MIRKATIEDIDQILTIHKDLFNVPYTYASFKFDIEDKYNIFHCFEQDNIVVGYYSFKMMIDEGELITIAIKKEYQHKGIGSILLEDLFKNARNAGIKKMFLEVSEHNLNAQNLYKKYDFKYTHTRYLYYGKDDNAYIYEKGLI